ncbi:MAG: flagellar basal body rod protein FlgC [Phycisphaerales bacterium]|nr:flagellar basal body rod protein FlgC [Phycisphaerae bacterium]NNF44750.1 flagellar basal body rod protein FlgC [Phycisphaerales bacterium]NNM26956.1 flagellar basal body rod protein FlgC [Phycisphaerales bacterium]
MYGALDISTSGLIAQRVRLTVSSANIANAKTLVNSDGEYEPYRRRTVILAPADPDDSVASGVRIAAIEIAGGDLRPEYDPTSRHADAEGVVYYPNVNPVVEQMNSMEALRAYEANVAAAEATKSMMNVALQMLA